MHILIFSWRDTKNPLSGGAESFLHELSKRIVKKGHQVTLFSSSYKGAKHEELVDGVQIIREGNRWTVHLKAFFWFKRQPRNTFDLVIDNFHALPFFTPFYTKTPIVGVIHEITRKIWFAETFFPINIIGYLLEPIFFIPYSGYHFLVASQSTKESLITLGHPEEQITVFFQGIDLAPAKKLPKKADFPLLICLSRLSPSKRFEHAIIAMSSIVKKVPKAQLWIAGSGKPGYISKLKRLVKQYGLENKVKFLGYTTGKKKEKLLRKAWLILGTSVREGWGLAITEAAAFGCPAVTYDVAGFRDSVKHGRTGIRVKTQEPEKIATAAIKLIGNKKRRNRLAIESIKSSGGRTRDKTAKQLIPLLKNIAQYKYPQPKPADKLRILITSWRDIKSPAAGGAEILTHEIAKRLVRWGHKVIVMAPVFPKASHIEKVSGVIILRPSFFFASRPIAYLNWPRFLVNSAATYRGQLASQVDVVIDQVHGLPSFTPVYVNKPVILFPLEVANEIWLTEIPFPGNVLGWIVERAYLTLFRNYPFITISSSTANDLKRFGIKRIKIITPGTNQPPSNLPQKSQNPSFICLGRVTKMKRLSDAIQAFKIFHKRYPESRLHIVGRGTHTSHLRRLTKELRLKRFITFYGFVGERKKYALLSRSWALLSTSLREGWGLNVIEAASVSTPTIAYKIPGIVDTVIDNKTGLLTHTNTPDALSERMTRLVENDTLRIKLMREATKHAKQFTWDRAAKQFLTAIKNLT